MRESLLDHRTAIAISERPICIYLITGTTNIVTANCQTIQTHVEWRPADKSQVVAISDCEARDGHERDAAERGEVSSFEHLGATLPKDYCSKTDTRFRIATAAMGGLDRVWSSHDMSFIVVYHKVNLYKYLQHRTCYAMSMCNCLPIEKRT